MKKIVPEVGENMRSCPYSGFAYLLMARRLATQYRRAYAEGMPKVHPQCRHQPNVIGAAAGPPKLLASNNLAGNNLAGNNLAGNNLAGNLIVLVASVLISSVLILGPMGMGSERTEPPSSHQAGIPVPSQDAARPEASWGNGRYLFFNDSRARCTQCHQVVNQTAGMGSEAQEISVAKGELISQSQSNLTLPVSIEAARSTLQNSALPDHVDLLDGLSIEQQQDLLAYLTQSVPQMPMNSPLDAPPLRSVGQVAQALAGSLPLSSPIKPVHIVLVDGIKDHGPGEHDYPAWQIAWRELLRSAPEVIADTARDFPDREQLSKADVIIFFQKGSFSFQRATLLDSFLKRGGGLVLIHWAVNGNERAEEFSRRIGLASKAGAIRYRHGPLTLDVTDPSHPIMRNFERLSLYDESYWGLRGDPTQVTVLATSREDESDTPQLWVLDHHPGRVFVSIPGHYNWTFDDPLFRIILLRGIAWTAGEPVDRWNELVFPGARINPNG